MFPNLVAIPVCVIFDRNKYDNILFFCSFETRTNHYAGHNL